MFGFLILSISLPSVLLSTVHRNHDGNFQNVVTKNRLKGDKAVDTSINIEDEPVINDNVNEIAGIYNVKRPSDDMGRFIQFQPKTLTAVYNKGLDGRNTKHFKERELLTKSNNALNEKLTLISRNEYKSHNVRFEIGPKSRRKRNINNAYENDKITDNILQNNVELTPLNNSHLSEDVTINNSYDNVTSNVLTLDTQPALSDANSSLNEDLKLNRRRIFFSTDLYLNKKEQLRSDIENVIVEIKKKVLPLTHVKIALGNDYSYRIGYVIASIDTLYNQMGKLKAEINSQDENNLIELLEKIKQANKVISNLLQMLTSYSTFVSV